MLFPWPMGVDDVLLDESLKIAMVYLEMTGQADNFVDVQRRVASTILAAWLDGVRHPIRLGNYGIGVIEGKQKPRSSRVVPIEIKTPH
jgi:hypothetical protein